MNESRDYKLTFSRSEVLEALRKAYPTHLAIQAIPADAKAPAEFVISWRRSGIAGD